MSDVNESNLRAAIRRDALGMAREDLRGYGSPPDEPVKVTDVVARADVFFDYMVSDIKEPSDCS